MLILAQLMATLLTFEVWAGESQFPVAGAPGAKLSGPTIRLDYGRDQAAENPVGSFIYFVPLISPDPVSCLTSSNNTQKARVISAQRRTNDHSFTAKCDFEITGQGFHETRFDLTNQIRRHERKLKEGSVLRRQLSTITVEGPCSGYVEVEGVATNGIQTVTEVRLRFNARGKTSPVFIGLCDVCYQDGAFQHQNEIVARVNTLTFRRKPGPPKMDVTVASVKKKGAGRNLWQSIKGGVKGLAANMLIDPLTVEATGHRAMLDFGQALSTGAQTFTFPHARNLKSSSESR